MTVFKWSQTAATNASADSSINWSEGQAPSSINDSARAVMSAVAKWRDDIGGTLTTGGTASAYVVSPTNQVFTGSTSPPPNGTTISFLVNATNAANATLSIDGGTGYPLTFAGANIAASVLQANTMYTATFRSSSTSWVLNNVYNFQAGIAPIGSITPYAGAGDPSANFLICDGRSLVRATYTFLFQTVWGNVALFGSADGSHFNLPDLRGRVIAGIDGTGRLTTATITNNPVTGNQFGATGGTEARTLSINDLPSHNHGVFLNDPQHSHPISAFGPGAVSARVGTGLGADVNATQNASTGITVRDASGGGGTANQTAPQIGFTGQTNVALVQPTILLNYLIRVL